MNVTQLRKFCRTLPGAGERLLPAPYNVLLFELEKHSFAYFKTSAPERWRFSIKVDAARFLELTDTPGVKPARWRGRWHWVTIVDVSTFPADYLRELVRWSHRAAALKLPRARRPGFTGESGRARE